MQGQPLAARTRLDPLLPAPRDAIAGLLGFAAILPLALFDGGYFPTSWGVPALVGLWIVALALALTPASLSRREAVALVALTALLVWSALSFLWSDDRPQTVLDVERVTIYVATLAVLLLVPRKESVPWLLAGGAAAIVITCGVGLAGRLFQDVFGRPEARIHDAGALFEPVGYSNALGDLSALGVLLLAGFLAHVGRPAVRALIAASAVIVLAALALSLSRAAWLALGAGVLVAVSLAPRRFALLGWLAVLALPGIALLAFALRADALLTRGAPAAAAGREGHRLALAIVGLAAGTAFVAAFGPTVAARLRTTVSPGRAAAGLALLVALALVATAIWVDGSTERPGNALRDPPRGREPAERFLRLSTGRREPFWEAAWRDFEEHPVIGSGSGTFGRYWLEQRTVPRFVTDAHSLYLESLAEVGLVGLVLLVVALGAPAVSAVRARAEPLVPAALGAYSVYLVHAGIDWLWEMPVPTTAALVCAAALLVAGRPAAPREPPRLARIAGVGVALALAALSFVGLIGNSATASAERALFAGDLERAEAQARRATRWSPWAAEPLRLLAGSQVARGDLDGARESLDRALERDPGDWRLWYERGLIAAGAERGRYLTRAMRLNPRDVRRLTRPE